MRANYALVSAGQAKLGAPKRRCRGCWGACAANARTSSPARRRTKTPKSSRGRSPARCASWPSVASRADRRVRAHRRAASLEQRQADPQRARLRPPADAEATAGHPDFCADLRAWMASGYTKLPEARCDSTWPLPVRRSECCPRASSLRSCPRRSAVAAAHPPARRPALGLRSDRRGNVGQDHGRPRAEPVSADGAFAAGARRGRASARRPSDEQAHEQLRGERSAQRQRERRRDAERHDEHGDEKAERDRSRTRRAGSRAGRRQLHRPLEREQERGEHGRRTPGNGVSTPVNVGPSPAAAPVSPSTSSAVAIARAGRSHAGSAAIGWSATCGSAGSSRGASANAPTASALHAGRDRVAAEGQRDGEESEPARPPRRPASARWARGRRRRRTWPARRAPAAMPRRRARRSARRARAR